MPETEEKFMSKPATKTISFQLDAELHKAFKMKCLENDTNIKEWLTRQIAQEVARPSKGRKKAP